MGVRAKISQLYKKKHATQRLAESTKFYHEPGDTAVPDTVARWQQQLVYNLQN